MDEIKIYVVNGNTHYASWVADSKLIDDLDEANIVLFTGGEDINPSLYGHKNMDSYSNPARDREELTIFNLIKPSQLAVGICRGSQALCCFNGGKLYQDVSNHAIGHTHPITDGEHLLEITSTHHQMQCPFNLPRESYNILWWTPNRLSSHYSWGGLRNDYLVPPVEPEIVEYHVKGKPICLAIQGHPEMMRIASPTINELNKLLRLCLTHVKSQNS